MSPERERLLRETLVLVEARSDEAARLFYAHLFTLDPDTERLFAHVDMRAQGEKFVAMLSAVVRAIDAPPQFVHQVASLGRRHAHLRVSRTQYESVGAALQHAVRETLGPRWTPEVRAVWAEAYALIAAVMQRVSGPQPALSVPEPGTHIPTGD